MVRLCVFVFHIRVQQQQRPFNGLWSGTTRVGRYQKKHSPTHTHPDHRASFFTFLNLQRSMASSLFNLCAWQSSRTGLLWSSPWSWTLNFMLHTFLHPVIVIFSQHMTVPAQPILLQYQCYVKLQTVDILAVSPTRTTRMSQDTYRACYGMQLKMGGI